MSSTEQKAREDEWYPLLVQLVNIAFDKLDTLQAVAPNKGIARLCGVSKGPQSVLLARPAIHDGYRGYPESKSAQLSPALVLVTAMTASRIYKSFDMDQFISSSAPRHQYHQVLSNAPDKECLWHEVLSPFEVQENHVKTKLRDPPSTYTVPARMDRYMYSHMAENGFDTFSSSNTVVSFPTASGM